MSTQSIQLTREPVDVKAALALAAGTYEVQFYGRGVARVSTAASAPHPNTVSARRIRANEVRRIKVDSDGVYAWVLASSAGNLIVDSA